MISPEELEQDIPAEWYMFASSDDNQKSNEAHNVGTNFNLPDPAGKEGGLCTTAFLQSLYRDSRVPDEPISYVGLLRKMREQLEDMGFDQKPQLSTSRPIDVNEPLYLVPPGCRGNKRAILIGINYVGQKGELKACWNDVNNIKDFLIDVHGFKERDMLILMDDGDHKPPTKKNIETAFRIITQRSKPGDVAFIHFSGHGGQTEDLDGDESDGFDETLIPLDFAENGQVVDDDILLSLVKPMRAGVHAVALMDCCNSGSVFDLPYVCGPEHDSMTLDADMKPPPKYRTVLESIQLNDRTLLQLVLNDPRQWKGEQFEKLCKALKGNFYINKVALVDNFLDGFPEEDQTELLKAIGHLVELEEFVVSGVARISFQQLEEMIVLSKNLRQLLIAGAQFDNNGDDYKAFVEVLREHPKVKKYNFDKCFFRDKEERPPYVPKLKNKG